MEKTHRYINFHAFSANLWQSRVITNDPTYSIWMHRSAHEEDSPETNLAGVASIYVLAAAQWIIWCGQSLFKLLLFPGEVSPTDLSHWAPGPLYEGEADFTLHRWRFWRDSYSAIAASNDTDGKGYSQECKDGAAKAAALMDAFEKDMTF